MTWTLSLALFTLIIFPVGSCMATWTLVLLLHLLHSWNYRCETPNPANGLRLGLPSFSPGLASVHDLPDFWFPSSWNVSHYSQVLILFMGYTNYFYLLGCFKRYRQVDFDCQFYTLP
jgi:hypothetical protein